MNAAHALYLAQGLNLLAFIALARWHAVPWLGKLQRDKALMFLIYVHLGRTLCLHIYSAQEAGMRISDASRNHVVIGDLLGWALALVILFCLRYRLPYSIPLIWLLIIETVSDIGVAIFDSAREGTIGLMTNTTWLIVAVYVPAMQVAIGLTVWQLIARRNEPLNA